MPHKGLHAGWLADDRDVRAQIKFGKKCRNLRRTEKSGFLVKGQGDMERHRQIIGPRRDRWQAGQHNGDKALHIDSPASIELAAITAQGEGITCPAIRGCRHHIHMR